MEFLELLELIPQVDIPLLAGFLGLGKLFGGGNKEPKKAQKSLRKYGQENLKTPDQITEKIGPDLNTFLTEGSGTALHDIYGQYSRGPESFYKDGQVPSYFGSGGPSSFFGGGEEGSGNTGLSTFDNVINRFTGSGPGGNNGTDFNSFFDDYNSYDSSDPNASPSGLGSFARHSSNVFGEEASRRAGADFERGASGLGASGLMSSSALSNLKENSLDDLSRTQSMHELGATRDALGLYAQEGGRAADRQSQNDLRFLNLGLLDHGATQDRGASDFYKGQNIAYDDFNQSQGRYDNRIGNIFGGLSNDRANYQKLMSIIEQMPLQALQTTAGAQGSPSGWDSFRNAFMTGLGGKASGG